MRASASAEREAGATGRARRPTALILVFLVCMSGLLVWRHVGIYPDEFSYRVDLARYFQDHGVHHGLWSLCKSRAAQIPALFVLPAMAFSAADLALDPAQMRDAYLGVLAATYAACLLALRNATNPWGAALLAASVAGVGGSALVMVRHEAALTLQVLACIAGWALAGRAMPWRLLAALAVIATTLASLYSHLQGLLFLPLAGVVLYRLLRPNLSAPIAVAAVLALLALAAAGTMGFHQASCTEEPLLEQFFRRMTADPGAARHWSFKAAWDTWTQFLSSFVYRKEYGAKYLPGLPDGTAGLLKGGARQWASLNLLVMASLSIVAAAAAAAVVHLLVDLLRGRVFSAIATDAPAAGHLLPTLLVLPTLALVVVDAEQNFYRSIYLNLLLAVSAALYAGSTRRRPRASLLVGGLVLATAAGSAIVNHLTFGPRLLEELGPSISAATDWKGVDRDVAALAARCGAQPADEAVVIHDDSYNALKGTHRILPLTYLSRQAGLVERPLPEVAAQAGASYVLAQCTLMKTTGLGWPAAARQGSLCCSRLKP